MVKKKTYKLTYREKGNPNADLHYCFVAATSVEVAKFSFNLWQSRENNLTQYVIVRTEKVISNVRKEGS